MPTIDRRTLLAAAVAAAGLPRFAGATIRSRPLPTPSQLLWQQDELAMFIHFGVNTFTDREWGDGKEDPTIFNPTALDAMQWARTAKEAGFKAMVLTAKHHDGFCLWPTGTTRHSVASSPFRGGSGDVVREYVDACRAHDLRVGLYLSPWDRNSPVYGDSPRYNDLYAEQLRELLTGYGPIHEIWFDGANGEGPNGRRQTYDWPRIWGDCRRYQPEAVMFSDAGPDIRWIGNEIGVAGDTNWSTVDPSIVTAPGMTGDEVMRSLTQGDRDGTVWRPGETDTSIRPGWFYHPAEDGRVRSAETLLGIYDTSVGRNSKLLLNVPPDRNGLLHANDVASLQGMRRLLDARAAREIDREHGTGFANDGTWGLRYPTPVMIDTIRLEEPISDGQSVARYRVEGMVGDHWRELRRGTTIGYARIDRIDPMRVSMLRVTVEDSTGPVGPLVIRGYGPA